MLTQAFQWSSPAGNLPILLCFFFTCLPGETILCNLSICAVYLSTLLSDFNWIPFRHKPRWLVVTSFMKIGSNRNCISSSGDYYDCISIIRWEVPLSKCCSQNQPVALQTSATCYKEFGGNHSLRNFIPVLYCSLWWHSSLCGAWPWSREKKKKKKNLQAHT